MKIALFVHCYFPDHHYGTEAYTRAVAGELLALGHEPVVVTARFQGEPVQREMVEEYTWEGTRVISIDKNALPHRSVRETYEQPAMARVHTEILQRIKPDIVHICHLINHTTAAITAASGLGIPVVSTMTDFFGFCFTNRLEAADGSLCEGPSSSRANCIACYLKQCAPVSTSRFAEAVQTSIRTISASFLATRLSQAPTVVDRLGFNPSDLIDRPRILARAFHNYRNAIAPSSFLKKAYEKNAFPGPITLSYFGIDIDRGRKTGREAGRPLQIGYIGQLAPHKGIHLLIEALRIADRANVNLVIWTPHDNSSSYFKSLIDSSQGLNVAFPGSFPLKDIARILAELDVVAIPSTWYENSPMILLQALATHTPVIVSDVEGMTEFVTHGYNGFHFARGDGGALAQIVQQFADDRELAFRLSTQTEYRRSVGEMTNDLVAIYETALHSGYASRFQ